MILADELTVTISSFTDLHTQTSEELAKRREKTHESGSHMEMLDMRRTRTDEGAGKTVEGVLKVLPGEAERE